MKDLKKYLTKKNMMIGGGILAAGIIVFLLMRGKKEAKETKAIGGSSSEPNFTNTEYSPSTGISWPLKRGSGVNPEEKAAVKVVQRWLNQRLKAPMAQLVVDGLFGVKTEAALIQLEGISTISVRKYGQLKQYVLGPTF